MRTRFRHRNDKSKTHANRLLTTQIGPENADRLLGLLQNLETGIETREIGPPATEGTSEETRATRANVLLAIEGKRRRNQRKNAATPRQRILHRECEESMKSDNENERQ